MNKNITHEEIVAWCNETSKLGRNTIYLHAPYTGIDFITKVGQSPYGSKINKKITKENSIYEIIKSHINNDDAIIDMTHGENNSWITISKKTNQKINWTKNYKSISFENQSI